MEHRYLDCTSYFLLLFNFKRRIFSKPTMTIKNLRWFGVVNYLIYV